MGSNNNLANIENSFLSDINETHLHSLKQTHNIAANNSNRNIINHFYTQKKNSNKPIIKNIHSSNDQNDHHSQIISIQELINTKSDSIPKTPTGRNASKNHVHFTSPLAVHTPTANEHPSGSKLRHSQSMYNKSLNVLPLKNIATIRSSSFRHNPNFEPKPENPKINLPNNNNNINNMNSKAKISKSLDNIDTHRELDSSIVKKEDSSTHSIHRLIKMACNWNSKSRSSSTSSNYAQQGKTFENSLISQVKIRQTHMFINDENEFTNTESALSRKLPEMPEKITKMSLLDDTSSDKSVKVYSSNGNLSKTPIKILPIRRLESSNDYSKKSSATEINGTDSVNLHGNSEWHNENIFTSSNSQISDSNIVKKDPSYLSKIKKSYRLVSLTNKNLRNSTNDNIQAKKANTTTTINKASRFAIEI